MGFATGITLAGMGMLVWAPLLALFGGLILWLAALIVLQKRRPAAQSRAAERQRSTWHPACPDPLTIP